MSQVRIRKVLILDSSGNNPRIAKRDYESHSTGNTKNSENLPSNSEAELKKERNRLKVREWRKDNPDKYKAHLEYVKQWRQENKDRVKERNKEWYQRNRDWLLEYYRNYYHNKKSIKSTKNDRNAIRSKRKNVDK